MRVILILLVLVTWGCEGRRGVTGPSPESPVIRGRVADYITDVGLSGAEIVLSGPAEVRMTSDARGAYVLPVPPLGRYEISVNGVHAGVGIFGGPTYRGDC